VRWTTRFWKEVRGTDLFGTKEEGGEIREMVGTLLLGSGLILGRRRKLERRRGEGGRESHASLFQWERTRGKQPRKNAKWTTYTRPTGKGVERIEVGGAVRGVSVPLPKRGGYFERSVKRGDSWRRMAGHRGKG